MSSTPPTDVGCIIFNLPFSAVGIHFSSYDDNQLALTKKRSATTLHRNPNTQTPRESSMARSTTFMCNSCFNAGVFACFSLIVRNPIIFASIFPVSTHAQQCAGTHLFIRDNDDLARISLLNNGANGQIKLPAPTIVVPHVVSLNGMAEETVSFGGEVVKLQAKCLV